jgi:SOS response regulatory protein OraA/RecX
MDEQAIYEYAFRSTYRYLGYRPRAEAEVRTYLARRNQLFTPEIIDRVVAKLHEYDYLNDAQFVQWYLYSRVLSRKKSLRLLARELAHIGVDRDVIEQQLELPQSPKGTAVADETIDDDQRAHQAGQHVWKRTEGQGEMERSKKVYAYLARRGYSSETIKNTIAKYRLNE